MIQREIIKVDRDYQGRITALRNQFKGWSPISVEEAINQIENELCKYFVTLSNVGKVDVHVIDGPEGKILRTDPEKTSRNNLLDLST